VVQEDLRSNRPWPIKHAPRDVAARVVAHLQTCLDAPASRIERLAERWNVVRGMETGADAYSARVRRRLPDRTRSELAARGHRIGDPILELSPGAEREQPWCEHPRFLARSPEPRALLYGTIDEANYTSLVWLRGDDDPPADIIAALEPWREVLRTRAEFARNPRRMWWETAWPRARETLTMPKVIALYRTDRGRFALDESGAWQPSNKTTIATARRDGLSVAYLCGLLNSELLDLWYAVRGKTPRDIWRNYEPKPMNEMPYRHVPRPAGWTPSNEVAELAEALAGGSSDTAVAVANLVRGRIGSPAGRRGRRARDRAPRACHRRQPHRPAAIALDRSGAAPCRQGSVADSRRRRRPCSRSRRAAGGPRSARCALTPSSRWSSRPTACSDALVCGTGRSSSLTDGGRRQASTAQPIVSRSWPRRSDRSGCFPMTCAECACR
jgi:TaqI-like C-terminal specificity domain